MLEKRHEMLQLNLIPCGEVLFGRPRGEFAEQSGVGFRRVVRLPALVAQVLQEILDQDIHEARMEEPAAGRKPQVSAIQPADYGFVSGGGRLGAGPGLAVNSINRL